MKYRVIRTGVLAAPIEEVRPIVLDLRRIADWHWEMEKIELLQDGDEEGSEHVGRKQRAYFYTKSEAKEAQSVEQTVTSLTENEVAFQSNRCPLHVDEIVLALEEIDGNTTKVRECVKVGKCEH
jgi:hypothetical protein